MDTRFCYCAGGGEATKTGLLHSRDASCPSLVAACDAEGHQLYLGTCGYCGLSEVAIHARTAAYEARKALRAERAAQ